MHHSTRFLAEGLAMPADLSGVHHHIVQLFHQVRSKGLARLRGQMLQSVSSGNSYVAIGGLYPVGPDASGVKRDTRSISLYLENIVAPQDTAGAREVIGDYLGMAGFAETAMATAELHPLVPDFVSALLELRPVRARRLYDRALATLSQEEREQLRHANIDPEWLIAEYERIQIAYKLRCVAQSCAAQIAEPTGWRALDGLDGGDSVRVGSVLQRLFAELALVERAIELYDRGRRSAGGLLAYNPLAPLRGIALNFSAIRLPASARAAKEFVSLGVDRQAATQLEVWRAAHGASLEAVLDSTVEHIRREIAVLRTRLKARERVDHHNKVLGNIGRCKAGLRLYLAVEEAVSWLAEPIRPEAKTIKEAARREFSPEVDEAVSAVRTALRWKADKKRAFGRCPMPERHPDHSFIVVQLFTALRFAFLHDNEMLPVSLRRVQDLTSREDKIVKTPARAADILGRAYSFEELWDAHERQRHERITELPPRAGQEDQGPRFANFTPDNEYRNAADKLRRTPARDLLHRERNVLGEFRTLIAEEYIAG